MLLRREIYHQALAIIPVYLNSFNMGMGIGWISPTLETLSHPDSVIPLKTSESSLIASLQEVGRIAGCILATLLLDTIGRRKSLMLSGCVFFVQWILIWATKSVWVICLARLFSGLGTGLQDISSSIYLSENSSPKIRGIFMSVMVSFFYLGVVGSFLSTNYLSYYHVALVNTIISGSSLIAAILLKEPVQHLIAKGNMEKAKKHFLWLRGTKSNENIDQEFISLQETIRKELNRKKSLTKVLSTPFIYKIISMVFVHYTLTQATGFSAVSSFATVSFSSSGRFTRKELTIFLGFIQLTAVSLSSLLIEKFARKTIMRTSYGFAAFVHLCSAILFYTNQYVGLIPNFSSYIFASISSFSFIYAFGVLPSFALMRGELFPQGIKAMGGCISITGNSLMGILINSLYLRVAQKYGMYVNYLFFSICSFFTVLYVHFVLPETRGKTLSEIQQSFGKSSIDGEQDRKREEI